jgi:hypothetical protein
MNLPVFVTVLSENVPQEHQLHMQAVLTAESSSPVQARQLSGPQSVLQTHTHESLPQL